MPPGRHGAVPPVLYCNWPGLDGSDKVVVDRERLRTIADQLDKHLRDLISASSGNLAQAGGLSPSAFGSWHGGASLAPTAQQAHTVLSDHHARFLESLLGVIKALRATAQVYDDKEAELERAVLGVVKLLESGHQPPELGGHPQAPVPSSSRPQPGQWG